MTQTFKIGDFVQRKKGYLHLGDVRGKVLHVVKTPNDPGYSIIIQYDGYNIQRRSYSFELVNRPVEEIEIDEEYESIFL